MGMKAKFGPADYEQRLNGGVVMWQGVPHKVNVDDHEINIHDLVTGKPVAMGIAPLDDNLDISSPPLGYINGDGCAYYLQRVSRRQYRQAITQNAIFEQILTSSGLANDYGAGRSEILYTKYFKNSFTQPYPTFEKAVEMLKSGDFVSVAINRHVAITMDNLGLLKVWYKNGEDPVGWIEPDGNVVKVPSSDKAWLISMYLDGLGWEVQ